MFDRKPRVSGAYLLVLASLSPRSQAAGESLGESQSIPAEHSLAGEVRAADDAAKTVVHTADGGTEITAA